jgi:hypothetical protein
VQVAHEPSRTRQTGGRALSTMRMSGTGMYMAGSAFSIAPDVTDRGRI